MVARRKQKPGRKAQFRVAHVNVRSLRLRIAEIGRFVVKNRIDVLAVQESWLEGDEGVTVPGYYWVGRGRTGRQGGGTGFLVSEQVVVKPREDLERKGLEATWVEVKRGGKTRAQLLLGSIYIPPREWQAIDILEEVVEGLTGNVALLGDFNAHSETWDAAKTDTAGRHLESVLLAGGLSVCNDSTKSTIWTTPGNPPRFPDLTILSDSVTRRLEEWYVGEDVGSDHLPIVVGLSMALSQPWREKRRVRDFSKADWELYEKSLEEKLGKWQEEQGEMSISEAYSSWLEIVRAAENQAVPTKGVSEGAKPWWSKEIGRLTRKKDKLRRKFQETGEPEVKEQYKKAQQELQKETEKEFEKDWRKKCEALNNEDLALDELMRLYRRTHDRRSKEPVSLFYGKREAVTRKEKVELQNQYYSEAWKPAESVGGSIGKWQRRVEKEFEEEHMETELSAVEEFQSDISEEEVQEAVSKLAERKAPGPDGVTPPLIKRGGGAMIKSLTTLFGRSWAETSLPTCWKEANICPIPKCTKPSQCDKFRPISLLSVVSKLMERIVARRLYRYVERENILPDYQAGFRRKHSTVDLLAELQQEVYSAFAERESVLFVMLDIEKAYDKAWRPGIMRRLRTIGVDGRMLGWICNFLKQRRARVVVDGEESDWRPSLYGVPQGSPLSPLLFNIFVAPVLSKVQAGRLMFADDIGLHLRGRDMRQLSSRMSRELAWVSRWAYKWKATFNLGKCSAMALTRKRPIPKPKVRFEGKVLQVPQTHEELIEHAKYLGVVLDPRLNWRVHLNMVRSKALKRMELLLRITNSRYGARHTRVLLLYKVCVRPALEYACVIWNDASAHLKTALIDSIQHRVLARAMGVRRATGREALEVETGVEPLELRRKMLTARTYQKLVSRSSRIAAVLALHRRKAVPILHSPLNSSFALRGETLEQGEYPRGCNFKKELINTWQAQWDSSALGRWFYHLQQRVRLQPAPWANKLPRWIVSTIAGMRLGNSAAKADLFRSGLAESSLCDCGIDETRAHYWLSCGKYFRERDELQTSVEWVLQDHIYLTMRVLIGFNNPRKEKNSEIRKAVVKFLQDTGRFKPQESA